MQNYLAIRLVYHNNGRKRSIAWWLHWAACTDQSLSAADRAHILSHEGTHVQIWKESFASGRDMIEHYLFNKQFPRVTSLAGGEVARTLEDYWKQEGYCRNEMFDAAEYKKSAPSEAAKQADIAEAACDEADRLWHKVERAVLFFH